MAHRHKAQTRRSKRLTSMGYSITGYCGCGSFVEEDYYKGALHGVKHGAMMDGTFRHCDTYAPDGKYEMTIDLK